MDVPTLLLRDLLRLSTLNQLDEAELSRLLDHLADAMNTAVPSYRGLSVTIATSAHPVTLTSFISDGDASVSTSLRIPFQTMVPGLDRESCVVLYAATEGAFVDLAADLGFALRTPFAMDGVARDLDAQFQKGVVADRPTLLLDVDVPPATLVSGVSGLKEVSVVNRAAGVLIDRGHHPDEAHAVLRRAAAEEGVEPHVYAARLLNR